MTPETEPASPQAQREEPGHGSGPPDPPQASHRAGNAKAWTHDALAADLAAHLRGPDRMVWADIQLGSAGSPTPDTIAVSGVFRVTNETI